MSDTIHKLLLGFQQAQPAHLQLRRRISPFHLRVALHRIAPELCRQSNYTVQTLRWSMWIGGASKLRFPTTKMEFLSLA